MSDISNIYGNIGAGYNTAYSKNLKSGIQNDNTSSEVTDVSSDGKKNYISGKTIGSPKLSEKAAKYYEELKKKYSNMDFILVSESEKQNAKANAASYAQSGKMVVLVDENKIERMAEDSTYRAQIEGIIEKTASGFTQFAESVVSSGAKVKGYGMQVNDDGTTSMFAVLEKSTKEQAKRIEVKREQKKAEKKEATKEAREEEREERIKNSREANRSDKENKTEKSGEIVINASSWEELIKKIEDYVQTEKANTVLTDAEKAIGQSIDFSV